MADGRMNEVRIRTPEGIEFSLWLAGPTSRFLAWLVDLACVGVLVSVVGAAVGSFVGVSRDLAQAIYVVLYFAVSVGYSIFLEWRWRGQSIGKRLLRLRVMDSHGLPLQFSQVVMRNLLRFVDSLPLFYMVGGVTAVLSERGQRLGDLAAGTVVVWQPNPSRLGLGNSPLARRHFNSLRGYPHLVARLRQRVTPDQADLALRAIERRDGLDPRARLVLFAELAGRLKGLVPFPSEALAGCTDEQFVQDVVDVLYLSERLENESFRRR